LSWARKRSCDPGPVGEEEAAVLVEGLDGEGGAPEALRAQTSPYRRRNQAGVAWFSIFRSDGEDTANGSIPNSRIISNRAAAWTSAGLCAGYAGSGAGGGGELSGLFAIVGLRLAGVLGIEEGVLADEAGARQRVGGAL
jgi:hypothetical protein